MICTGVFTLLTVFMAYSMFSLYSLTYSLAYSLYSPDRPIHCIHSSDDIDDDLSDDFNITGM